VGLMNDGDAGNATAAAVAEAKRESGYVDQPSVLDASIARATERQDDDAPPSAEDLEAISRDPQKKAVYRSLVKQVNEKTQRLEAKRQEMESAHAAVDAIRRDPKAAVRVLAQATGGRLVEEPTVADRVRAHLASTIGQEAADALGPALIESVKALAGDMVAPFAQEREERQQQENKAAIQSQVTTFANSITEAGGDYDIGIEREMAALVTSMPPGPQANAQQYMKILYNEVMARRGRGRGRGPARRDAPAAIRAGMDPRSAVRAAVAAARRDLGR
jgi:hypothetical protein